jgi:hypothetical protein
VASIPYNDVRDVLNLTSADIPDSKVLKMIGWEEVTPEVELSKDTDYADITKARAILNELL